MPSQERKPMFCITHSQLDLKAKPLVAWNQERKSFVSQIYFIINHCCWRGTHGLGRRENLHGINAWKPCRSIQYNNAAQYEASFPKDALLAQNTKMSSSIVISQMIDENKSEENKAAFPMQSVITQSDAYHMNQSLVNHSSVNINSAFILLPRRLGLQMTSDGSVFGADSETKEERQCHNQKGFTSITITARRVVPPYYQTTQAGASDPSSLQCQGDKLLMSKATALAVSGLDQESRPLHNQRSQNQTALMKPPELCPQLSRGPSDRLSRSDNKENRMVSPERSHNQKAPSSFISSVHLHVSQQSPNTIYYVDRSLSVPINQTQNNSQKMHRSVVSFNINCSSPGLTPDGVDGLANGKLITEVLKTELPEDSKTPLRAIWNAEPKEIYLDRKQTLETESLGTEYLWKCTSPTKTLSVPDSLQGRCNLKLTKSNDKNSSDNCSTLSLLIPHWTDDEDSQAFSRSNRKQCKRDKCHEAPALFLDQSSKHELPVEGGSYLKDQYPFKGTLKSKEIQAISFLKPKISVSDYECHGKALLKTALDENDIHGNDHFSKGDCKFFDAADKLREHNASEKKVTTREVTATSTVHVPDVNHEKHEAFQQPGLSSEPENIPSNPLTLREALEVHKPDFISRSQERLKKLEQLVQLRKTLQGDASGKKQEATLSRNLSSSSITSKKKQYTVPHPLSVGNIDEQNHMKRSKHWMSTEVGWDSCILNWQSQRAWQAYVTILAVLV
ncbi:(E2-independent) E3 ubiquitin-conjugating enzyme FATS isoform X2 [Paroedura picta]|uniref:(E2-independent) E3 ubiquitin-conjugating enzyme FATS isoform X2 n=1 Tax=Paroedura picta TaxID=143630 RepID=UPI004056987E